MVTNYFKLQLLVWVCWQLVLEFAKVILGQGLFVALWHFLTVSDVELDERVVHLVHSTEVFGIFLAPLHIFVPN